MFLANENVPLKSIHVLRDAGFQTVSIAEETPSLSDRDVLKRANRDNLIILTFDRDYGELIYRHKLSVPGIVYFKFRPSVPDEPAVLLLSLMEGKNIRLHGRFTVLEKEKLRQRVL